MRRIKKEKDKETLVAAPNLEFWAKKKPSVVSFSYFMKSVESICVNHT